MTLYEAIITRMINKGKTDEQITRAIYKVYGLPIDYKNQYSDIISENLENDIKYFRNQISEINAIFQKISDELAKEL